MKVLIMVAHGSRREASNREFVDLVASVRQLLVSEYNAVEESFLDCADPSLDSVIERLASQGATKIVVFPYFLNSGNHVSRDIPEIINRFRQSCCDCEIELRPMLGAFEAMAGIVAEQVN